MSKQFTTRVGAAVAAGAFVAVCFAGPADAAKPAERACLGGFFSFAAQALPPGEFGQTVANGAGPDSPLPVDNYGQAIQNLQAGTASLYPFVCNSPD